MSQINPEFITVFFFHQILIVNNKACSLLGYSSGELCGMRFSELLRNRKCKGINLQEPEQDHGDVSEDGTIVLLSGKVNKWDM